MYIEMHREVDVGRGCAVTYLCIQIFMMNFDCHLNKKKRRDKYTPRQQTMVHFQGMCPYLYCTILFKIWFALFVFCVTCEAWSKHRDHDSVEFVVVGLVVCVVIVRGVTLLVSGQYLLNECINFIQSL